MTGELPEAVYLAARHLDPTEGPLGRPGHVFSPADMAAVSTIRNYIADVHNGRTAPAPPPARPRPSMTRQERGRIGQLVREALPNLTTGELNVAIDLVGAELDAAVSQAAGMILGLPACGCPRDGATIRHRQATCTDPVVHRLGWFAGAGDAVERVDGGQLSTGDAVSIAGVVTVAEPGHPLQVQIEPYSQGSGATRVLVNRDQVTPRRKTP